MHTQLERYAAKVLLTTAISMSLMACSKPVDTAASMPSTTVGTEIDDTVVTASVRSALLADPDVKSLDVKVETRKGEVQLSGFVDNLAQAERISAIVKGVQGVKTIDNKMAMKTADTTVGNKVDDAIVTTRVKAALLADESVKSFDIAVVTRKGEVQLSGFVENQGQIDRAVQVARAVEDVHSVSNQMTLKK
ncbi:MAG: BON domain-containing protein [Burkholderiales bacterium]|jgi:hyperosmotically inducible protein|nr:BON domain-containing protein [Burkholderiales bacterium]